LFHLHQLAVSVDRYIQAEEWIAAKGFVGGVIQEFKGGATNISGYMTVREKMIKKSMSYLNILDSASRTVLSWWSKRN
jgi:hypothetical protein